jgi:hypothetical protein
LAGLLPDTRPGRLAAAILVAGFGVMLALNAPGQLSYDSVTQLTDGRAGHYNSWHPPLMAFLLGAFDRLVPGTFLFLLCQSLLLLGGMLALLALRPRGWLTPVLALAIVLTPQWLLYQGAIWKDILFAAAAIAGFAALAWQARTPRPATLILATVLLAAVAAVRQNGIILLPVAAATLALTGPGRWKQGLGLLAGGLVLLLAIGLALAPRTDGGDGAAAEVRLAQSYDMAGAFARDPQLVLPLPPDMDRLLKGPGARLYTPLRNDPFAAHPGLNQVRSEAPSGVISGAWQALVTQHTLLYLSVRWDDFRAVVTTPDPSICHFVTVGVAGSPEQLRQLGISLRNRAQDRALRDYARLFSATPIFSHLVWGLLAIVLLAILLWRRTPADLAVAGLLAGALLFALSFFFLSIACDYRYLIFLDFAAMAAALHTVAPKAAAKG